MFALEHPTPVQEILDPWLDEYIIRLFIKRDDLIDPEISGNKWRKLKYNFIQARAEGYDHMVTFGGAYSNHIAATAAAARRYGFKCTGIIRGDELNHNSNPTLRQAHANGMQLNFISRSEYRLRHDAAWLQNLTTKYRAYLIPEGGTNSLAIRGVGELVDEIHESYDIIVCPVGTGGTLAGIARKLPEQREAIGIAVLSAIDLVEQEVNELVGSKDNWRIIDDYHFGGYAKVPNELLQFIEHFQQRTGIPLDPVYTGKMMYAIYDMIRNGKFTSNSQIMAIHTGGLQGVAGFNERKQASLHAK